MEQEVYIPLRVVTTSVKKIQHPMYVSIGLTRRISSAMLNSKTTDIVTYREDGREVMRISSIFHW